MNKNVIGLVIGAIAGLCLVGAGAVAIFEGAGHNPDPTVGPVAAPSGTDAATASSRPPASARPTIGGDDIVHVGEDVPAGVYRAATSVTKSSGCYWVKSSDAEGADIIDNDLPTGGRPQVTLKAGQWFTSSDCPAWVKR